MGSAASSDWEEVIKLPHMTYGTWLHRSVAVKTDQRGHRSSLYAHWLRLTTVYSANILLTPLFNLWLLFGSTQMDTRQTENIDLVAIDKYSNSGFLTCGLCRSSSCCFSRRRSFSICWSLIWLWVLGGSCPPCFTGALCVILCWFMAAERGEKKRCYNLLKLKLDLGYSEVSWPLP